MLLRMTTDCWRSLDVAARGADSLDCVGIAHFSDDKDSRRITDSQRLREVP